MKKLYVRIQYKTDRHSIIRIDNIKEFEKYFKNKEVEDHFDRLLFEIKLGEKPKVEPYVFNVDFKEFNLLVSKIKNKISSPYKKEIHFKSISIVEDSYHYPMIRILTPED